MDLVEVESPSSPDDVYEDDGTVIQEAQKRQVRRMAALWRWKFDENCAEPWESSNTQREVCRGQSVALREWASVVPAHQCEANKLSLMPPPKRLRQSQPSRNAFEVLPHFLIIALLPFLWLYFIVRRRLRKWRFPFKLSKLRANIRAVHPSKAIYIPYLNAVVDGYWESAPEFIGFAQNMPAIHGRNDGGSLRRGEIDISAIPTVRYDIVEPLWPPWLRTKEKRSGS